MRRRQRDVVHAAETSWCFFEAVVDSSSWFKSMISIVNVCQSDRLCRATEPTRRLAVHFCSLCSVFGREASERVSCAWRLKTKMVMACLRPVGQPRRVGVDVVFD